MSVGKRHISSSNNGLFPPSAASFVKQHGKKEIAINPKELKLQLNNSDKCKSKFLGTFTSVDCMSTNCGQEQTCQQLSSQILLNFRSPTFFIKQNRFGHRSKEREGPSFFTLICPKAKSQAGENNTDWCLFCSLFLNPKRPWYRSSWSQTCE